MEVFEPNKEVAFEPTHNHQIFDIVNTEREY